MEEIDELINQKREIEDEIKKLKLEIKTKRNNKSELLRVSLGFYNEIEEIVRERNKKFPKQKNYKSIITNLIINHECWNQMKLNIIGFDFEKEK